MHFCEEQRNMSRMACCQFVVLLNDTNKIPFCNDTLRSNATGTDKDNATLASFKVQTTPGYLRAPSEVPEDHATFLFGVFVLIAIAATCMGLIVKFTKPKITVPLSSSFSSMMDYDLLMFLPSHRRHRSSVLVYLRTSCRSRRLRRSSLCISSSSATVIPSYRSAATVSTTATISPVSVPPPPSYEEVQLLNRPGNS